MNFRTEIGDIHGSFKISHDDRIVMLGSCFADNVGSRLEQDGFNVVHNPLGPLFNPASTANVLARNGRPYSTNDFVRQGDIWHCLDFASRYQARTAEALAEKVNADYMHLWQSLENASVIILTFGTNKVYERQGKVVGNCHKLPADTFTSRFLSLDEILQLWKRPLIGSARAIFTLSPVKYPGDGLAANCLSKSTLRLAIDAICRRGQHDYFPAFEIVTEDLRDYRFYAPDLKHPSDVAIEYIYDHFASAYFSKETLSTAQRSRKEYLAGQHRRIISDNI